MVSEGEGGYIAEAMANTIVYLHKDLAKDSNFLSKGDDTIFVKVSLALGSSKLMIEWYARKLPP